MTSKIGRGAPEVVVTGVTATTSLATDAETTWQHLLAGRSGITELSHDFVGLYDLPVRIGGTIGEDFTSELTRVELRRLSTMQHMALILGRRAWEAAGSPEVDSDRLTVAIASGLGSTEEMVSGFDDMKVRGIRAVSPLHVQMFMPNGPAATVGLDRKAKAGVVSPTVGDASGAAAVVAAWRQLVTGEADVAVCGGVEQKLEATPLASLSRVPGLLSRRNDTPAAACRPFDAGRDGTVLAEGGALLVLETAEHARARGATVLARLHAGAVGFDGHDDPLASDPSGEELAYAIGRGVALAGLTRADIGHVNAHAIGSSAGDLAEARAVRSALGDHPAVYAPKSALGHTLGAAGALEAVLTVLTLRDQVIPPTLNHDDADPQIGLDVVSGTSRPVTLDHAVSVSAGFGGNNVVLVFGR